tara:strand:+ start:44043 stop:44567 length:525 start_codon:yes stop_codon:yes gene_type:complete
MDEIIEEFKLESIGLVEELMDILDDIEGQFEDRNQLENYGQVVDRIMGGAKSLAMSLEESGHLEQVGNYAELCKLVGYKAAQIEENEQFYDIVHGLLFDATEMLMLMVRTYNTDSEKDIKELLSTTFLDRLKWVNGHFGENVRGTLKIDSETSQATKSQADIDALMKNLGFQFD